MRIPDRKLNGDHCFCSTCGEYFNSTTAFDRHRKGDYPDSRYCLAPEALTAKGMQLNATGWWITHGKADSYLHSVARTGDRANSIPTQRVGDDRR